MKRVLALSALMSLSSVPGWAMEGAAPMAAGSGQAGDSLRMGTIIVEDTRIQEPSKSTLYLDERAKGPVTDGGDLLKTLPGIAGGRMGGHGMDPVLRGQSHNRINILLDGAYVYGGCPNRMDPPSSYGTSETYDEVEVIKGAQSLQHGGGGSGGTVLFKRNTERFTEETWYRGKASAGYRGNADVREGFFDLAIGKPGGYGRIIGNTSRGDDYEDGDGNRVRAGYEENTGNLLLGLTPGPDSKIELGYEVTRADDLTYAGSGMDTPFTDHDMFRLKTDHKWKEGLVRGVKVELYNSQVDHLMDNYTLRSPPTMMGNAMYMRTPSESDTRGGRLVLSLATSFASWDVGIDYQDNERTAVMYDSATASADDVNRVNSYLWPDASIESTGLFAEMERELGASDRMKAGVRVDFVRAEANRADADPPDQMRMMNGNMMTVNMMSANDLYTTYYGAASGSREKETNVGGLLRFEHDYADDVTAYLSLSRNVRTADATERFMAKNNRTASNRWVGNPFIDPEQHHQLDLGVQFMKETWDLDGSLFYNRVSDYILRDRDHARGNATIYRNADARFFGGELSVNRRWNGWLRSGVNLAYVYADNTSDDRPIAQTPPLDVALTTDYEKDSWHLGAKVRLVAKQTRVDDDINTGSGQDVGQTAGFQVADLYGSYRFENGVRFKAGVNNLFDTTYAEHLNRGNTFDTTQTQVNEPGRSVWVTADMAF